MSDREKELQKLLNKFIAGYAETGWRPNGEDIEQFLVGELAKDRQKMARALRMKGKPKEKWMLGSDVGYNQAVEENNNKLDSYLKKQEGK